MCVCLSDCVDEQSLVLVLKEVVYKDEASLSSINGEAEHVMDVVAYGQKRRAPLPPVRVSTSSGEGLGDVKKKKYVRTIFVQRRRRFFLPSSIFLPFVSRARRAGS
jgi:hypothetical protein